MRGLFGFGFIFAICFGEGDSFVSHKSYLLIIQYCEQ